MKELAAMQAFFVPHKNIFEKVCSFKIRMYICVRFKNKHNGT